MSPSSAKCFHIWFDISKVTSVEKREPGKHFSASSSFLGSLFSTLVTLEKLKSDSEKFYFRYEIEKNQNKTLLLHLRSPKFLCSKDIYFLTRQKLEFQVSSFHKNEKPYPCNLCNKSFGLDYNLASHIKFVHNRIKKFSCIVCDKKFPTKFNLNRHRENVH